MLSITPRARDALRSVRRLAAGMATVAQRIGDTKVPMSLLEKGAYINYQRIEDNLAIVRERCSDPRHSPMNTLLTPPRGLGCVAH